jgi:hypothetical protein
MSEVPLWANSSTNNNQREKHQVRVTLAFDLIRTLYLLNTNTNLIQNYLIIYLNISQNMYVYRMSNFIKVGNVYKIMCIGNVYRMGLYGIRARGE